VGLRRVGERPLSDTAGAVSAVHAYRVAVGERALIATIGDPYRRYMSRTKRSVPFVF
jgi:protein-S-isoprenylcysteine O-methyltransferase Ste14